MSACSHCQQAPLVLTASGCCRNCGRPQAPATPVETPTSAAAPSHTLTLSQYCPGAPPGVRSSFALRFQPAPGQWFRQAVVQLMCSSFDGPLPTTLDAGEGFQRLVEFTPNQAGIPVLRVRLQAQTLEGQWVHLQGETQLVILGQNFEYLDAWRERMTVKVNNLRGLVRLEESLDGVDELHIDTEEGLTRLRNCFNPQDRRKELSWEFPLFPVETDDLSKPQPLSLAYLEHQHPSATAITWLIRRREVLVMGRSDEADIPLQRYPLDEDQRDISRRWLELYSVTDIRLKNIRQGGLERSTRLDDSPVLSGDPPRPWLPGQTLILRDLLGLRYTQGEGWLHLSRTLNGETEADYLIVDEVGYPLGEAARLRHGQGGFVLQALQSGVQINGQWLLPGAQRGLWDGDTIINNGDRFIFRSRK